MMRWKIVISLPCSVLLAITWGCQKRAMNQSAGDPDAAQNMPVTHCESGIGSDQIRCLRSDYKGRDRSNRGFAHQGNKEQWTFRRSFLTSQYFYTAAEFSKSVSLAVTQNNPDFPSKRSPKDFWKETFGRGSDEEKARAGDKEKRENLRSPTRGTEEEEKSVPRKKIAGIGDEAYWYGSRVGGALYVLKKDAFIRLSVGGQHYQIVMSL
jgi:hypothetical protein